MWTSASRSESITGALFVRSKKVERSFASNIDSMMWYFFPLALNLYLVNTGCIPKLSKYKRSVSI